MAALSIERYRSIVKNQPLCTVKNTTTYVIMAIWLFAIAMSLPTVIEFGIGDLEVLDEASGNVTLIKTCHQVVSVGYSMTNGFVVLLLSYIIPQVVVYTNYLRLAHFIWLKSKTHHQSSTVPRCSLLISSKVRVIKMLVWTATLFTLAWIPFFTLQTIEVRY